MANRLPLHLGFRSSTFHAMEKCDASLTLPEFPGVPWLHPFDASLPLFSKRTS